MQMWIFWQIFLKITLLREKSQIKETFYYYIHKICKIMIHETKHYKYKLVLVPFTPQQILQIEFNRNEKYKDKKKSGIHYKQHLLQDKHQAWTNI